MKKIAVLSLALALLAGCGVKPGSVEPPEGEEGNAFPQTYPDIGLDPGVDAAKHSGKLPDGVH